MKTRTTAPQKTSAIDRICAIHDLDVSCSKAGAENSFARKRRVGRTDPACHANFPPFEIGQCPHILPPHRDLRTNHSQARYEIPANAGRGRRNAPPHTPAGGPPEDEISSRSASSMQWVVKRNEEHSPAVRLPDAQEVPLEDVSRNCVQRGPSGSSINRTLGFAAGARGIPTRCFTPHREPSREKV
jgi:hypothetical protein